jgi:hypothetical protein
MIFIFKKKKIILDCFTNDNVIFDHYQISKASDFIPEWFKNAPKEYDDNIYKSSTIKRCIGVNKNLTSGFILPMWSQLSIKIRNQQYQWQFSDMKTQCKIHDPLQWNFFVNPNEYGHIKIESPHLITSKHEINFLYTKSFWHSKLNNNLLIPSGIVDYKYQHGTHLNMFINTKENNDIFIDQNDPIIQIIPLTEKNIKLKYHLISDEEFRNKNNLSRFFTHNYQISKNLIDKKEKKCPFGFGN